MCTDSNLSKQKMNPDRPWEEICRGYFFLRGKALLSALFRNVERHTEKVERSVALSHLINKIFLTGRREFIERAVLQLKGKYPFLL